jgi:hypothetical protein
MSSKKVSFVNTRARFQRISDAKLFNGWVNTLSTKTTIVSVNEPIRAQPGQIFRFEVYGKGAIAVFEARLEIASGTLIAFGICSQIRAMPSKEDMRQRTQNLTALLYRAPDPEVLDSRPDNRPLDISATAQPITEAQVVDVSTRGVGILSTFEFDRGEMLRLVINTQWGPADCLVEVRYCKPEGERFRIGLLVQSMDRLSQGIYTRLTGRMAA